MLSETENIKCKKYIHNYFYGVGYHLIEYEEYNMFGDFGIVL